MTDKTVEVWVIRPLVARAQFMFEDPLELLEAVRALDRGKDDFSCIIEIRHMTREELDAVPDLVPDFGKKNTE